MRFLTWLNREERSHPAERRGGHGPPRRRAASRPRLEMLEERRVLSTLTVTRSVEGVAAGDGTLRGEIAAAQSGDTIVFDPGLTNQRITLTLGELEISKNLTIQGPGAGALAISGGGALGSRVFHVDAGANVTISGLTVRDGYGEKYNNQSNGGMTTGPNYDEYDGYGGGILNFGTLTLSGCDVTANVTKFNACNGGGIYNAGTLTMSAGSNVSGNSASTPSAGAEGGGISNTGTLTLSGCNVTSNSASTGYGGVEGGGIYNNGTLTLSGGCNVTGNSASSGSGYVSKGGGIFNDALGSLTILSSTVTNNTASDGADICTLGTMTVKNSTIGKVSKK